MIELGERSGKEADARTANRLRRIDGLWVEERELFVIETKAEEKMILR